MAGERFSLRFLIEVWDSEGSSSMCRSFSIRLSMSDMPRSVIFRICFMIGADSVSWISSKLIYSLKGSSASLGSTEFLGEALNPFLPWSWVGFSPKCSSRIEASESPSAP